MIIWMAWAMFIMCICTCGISLQRVGNQKDKGVYGFGEMIIQLVFSILWGIALLLHHKYGV